MQLLRIKRNVQELKSRYLNLLLILTSLIGYLEWGGNQHAFLFQAEAEILSVLFRDPASVIHPFILLPLAGQIILLITLFQKTPGRRPTNTGITALGMLLGLMFLIGLMTLNYKIVVSAIPFIVVAVLAIREHRKFGRSDGTGLPRSTSHQE